MAYKLDLRKSVANLSGRMSSRQILQVFKDKLISHASIFRVLKDCRDDKKQENKKKSGRPPKLKVRTTKSLLLSAIDQSTRRLGRKFGISYITVHRILTKK